MRLKSIELAGFKSFAHRTVLLFDSPVTAIVGPNGSGKSNVADAVRFVLGERSLKQMRGRRGDDLVFAGGPNAARAVRATVNLVLTNGEEVKISREVWRNGDNVYRINETPVLFRDLLEKIGGVSIGASAHFVIGQGEVDRIINLSERERRALVEEALGLSLLRIKIAKSEEKLAQTGENMDKVESLRRELAPHLRFLKKQVEKIERADKLRRELLELCLVYFGCEQVYLAKSRESLKEELARQEVEWQRLRQQKSDGSLPAALSQVERELATLAAKIASLTRESGRLEGKLESAPLAAPVKSRPTFSFAEVERLIHNLEKGLTVLEQLSDLTEVRLRVKELKDFLARFLQAGQQKAIAPDDQRAALLKDKEQLEKEIRDLETLQNRFIQEREKISRQTNETDLARRTRENELRLSRETIEARLEKLQVEEENLRRELTEARALLGEEVSAYHFRRVEAEEPRSKQEERRRQMERLKIKLEDAGAGSSDILKEYREVAEREEFLAKELADLTAGAVKLKQIIADFKVKLNEDFKRGLALINDYFDEFVKLLFDGGSAKLAAFRSRANAAGADEEAEVGGEKVKSASAEEGLEIKVSLPRKKTKSLDMFSGGERSLISVALLFAMSRANPPPFLVLDETDAALDEANSRKYGQMVKALSAHSQLILITHNRETMSHAGLLYGVTMGRDGVSKLLSVKLAQAEELAKI